MKTGLRVDVDTYHGTAYGVPELMNILKRHGIRATFFFSCGPDNMGRHIWRILKPKFLFKMLRSNAGSIYGLNILFAGTLIPGRKIAAGNRDIIRKCADVGHEIGVHCWDHYEWQVHGEKMTEEEIARRIYQAVDVLTEITGKTPLCSAAAGFRCTEAMLRAKERFNFAFNCDCRGEGIFLPIVNGKPLKIPQIPFSIPTYDEIIGRNGINQGNYNSRQVAAIIENCAQVFTIHAEVEGGKLAGLFEEFLYMAEASGIEFCPLGEIYGETPHPLPEKKMCRGEVPGREGWVSVKEEKLT